MLNTHTSNSVGMDTFPSREQTNASKQEALSAAIKAHARNGESLPSEIIFSRSKTSAMTAVSMQAQLDAVWVQSGNRGV